MSRCFCDTCEGYAIQFVGRGLLQITNASNYIPIAYVLNKMATIGITEPSYVKILKPLPTAKLYPPLWGQKDSSNGNYIKPCSTTEPLDTTISCAQAPVLQEQIYTVCDSIRNKDQNIYSNPQSICETTSILPILTSLIYYSANTIFAVKDMSYNFRVSSCSVNQGGFLYPIKTTDWSYIEHAAYPIYREKPADILDKMKKCTKPEGYIGRYQGLNTVLGILFGNRMVYSDNGKWLITLNNKQIYRGDDITHEASLRNY